MDVYPLVSLGKIVLLRLRSLRVLQLKWDLEISRESVLSSEVLGLLHEVSCDLKF